MGFLFESNDPEKKNNSSLLKVCVVVVTKFVLEIAVHF